MMHTTSTLGAKFMAAALTMGLMVGLSCGMASTAFAQTGSQDDANSGSQLSSTSTTTTTTAVTAGGISLIMLTLTPGAKVAGLRHYMNHNRVALLQDTTTGAGQSVSDLAQIFAVPATQQARFGKLLQRRRLKIRQWLTGPQGITLAQAQAFTHMIRQDMSADPELRPHVPITSP